LKIEHLNPFKSLAPFGSIELPPFTVVVGLNGTGKSQLLEGIQIGRINCDAVTNPPPHMIGHQHSVVRLTNASLTLQSEMFVTPNTLDDGKSFTRADFESHRDACFGNYAERLETLVQGTDLAGRSPAEILSMPLSELTAVFPEDDSRAAQIQYHFSGVNSDLSNSVRAPAHTLPQQAIQRVVVGLGIEARCVTYEQASTLRSWGDHSLFGAQLPRLFASYRDDQVWNSRRSGRPGRAPEPGWLDEEAFEAEFGPPPWEQLSAILQTFGLNYRFAPPGPRVIDPVSLFFERLDDKDTHVEFGSLSAGEKVLVILAVALLNVDPIRATIQRPELLLLDEIDASLHPAVLHQWITTIQEKVVEEMGIPCILTTHSPVTVALTAQAALFEISRETPPLRKISQREALNKLTVGLPSMEVDFTRRRQVFVEAEVDAEAYDRLYTLMKAEMQLARSLHFLSTGIKNKDGVEQGTGCAAVTSVVENLAGYGSLSTFGLLDWDGKRNPEGRIQVLAQGSHYAFDNVILNPLLIGLLLIRDGRPPADALPRFGGADNLSAAELQLIADSVQAKLTYPKNAPTGTVVTHFIGGGTITTDRAFCECNGHKMEEALGTCFPSLNQYIGKGRGKLALGVIERVLGDYPTFCPAPIADAFRALADSDP
jgi:predicted ATPase